MELGVAIWELRCGSVNDFAMLASVDREDARAGLFDADGKEQDWMHRPAVEFIVDPRKKKQKPRADVIAFVPGALVLNEKADGALGQFLSQFGQLLELHCGGEILHFFNATKLIDCIDVERSEKRRSGAIAMEAFDESNVPQQAAVFKDPRMAAVRIYVNDAGRAEIERIVAADGLTGIECGSPQRF
jgi:hypothetical protein